jgi:beta-mannosidase
LEQDGKMVNEGSVLFAVPKHYHFSNPHLRAEIQGDEVVITSDAYAKAVQIEGVDGDMILEDNFFDMEKGEKRVRILSGKAKSVSLKSVYDIR